MHSLGLKFGIHIMRGIPRQAVHQNTKIKGTDNLKMHKNVRHSHQVWRRDINGVEHIVWMGVSGVSIEGGLYVAVFNAGETDSKISVALSELEIYNEVTSYELWSKETKKLDGVLNVELPKHGAKVFYLT